MVDFPLLCYLLYRSVFEPPVLVSGVLFQWPNRPGRRQICLGGDVELGSVPWMKDRTFDVWEPGRETIRKELHPGRLTAGTYSHHPWKRKENDLKTNLQGIMVHVNFCRVYPLFRLSRGFAIGVLGLFPQNFWKTPETTSSHLFLYSFFSFILELSSMVIQGIVSLDNPWKQIYCIYMCICIKIWNMIYMSWPLRTWDPLHWGRSCNYVFVGVKESV